MLRALCFNVNVSWASIYFSEAYCYSHKIKVQTVARDKEYDNQVRLQCKDTVMVYITNNLIKVQLWPGSWGMIFK